MSLSIATPRVRVLVGMLVLSLCLAGIADSTTYAAARGQQPVGQALPTPTFTPIPRATSLPSTGLPSKSVQSTDGWRLQIERMELRDRVETPSKRYRPQNGAYLIVVGVLTNLTDENGCIKGRDFAVVIGNEELEMERALLDQVKELTDERDYPGFFSGQCPNYDQSEPTFLIFDVPTDEFLLLRVQDTVIPLGIITDLQAGRKSAPPTPTPTPKPTNTPTPRPTATPKPNPTATATIAAAASRAASVQTAAVLQNANIRSGPGTGYGVVETVNAGDTVTIVGKNPAGDWYQIGDDRWIAAFLVRLENAGAPTLGSVNSAAPRASTSVPDASMSLEDYTAQFLAVGLVYAAGMETFGGLWTDAGNDLSLLYDPGWRSSVRNVIKFIKDTGVELRQITPPAALQGVHAQMLQAAEHFDTAMDLSSTFIDTLDSGPDESLVDKIVAEMQAGAADIEAAANLAEALTQ